MKKWVTAAVCFFAFFLLAGQAEAAENERLPLIRGIREAGWI